MNLCPKMPGEEEEQCRKTACPLQSEAGGEVPPPGLDFNMPGPHWLGENLGLGVSRQTRVSPVLSPQEELIHDSSMTAELISGLVTAEDCRNQDRNPS